MSWKVIGILVVIGAVLAAGVVMFAPKQTAPTRDAGPLFEIAPAEVAAIEFALGGNQGGEDREIARFERQPDGGWIERIGGERRAGGVTGSESAAGANARVVGGVAWPVNPSNIQMLMRELGTLEIERTGQSAPGSAVWFTLESNDGERQRGAASTAAIGGRVSVWAEDGATGSATTSILRPLTKPGPAGWRVREVFPGLARTPIESVRIERAGGSIALERDGSRWMLTMPATARANPDAVEQLVRTIAGLRIESFADQDDAFASETDAQRDGVLVGRAMRVSIEPTSGAEAVVRTLFIDDAGFGPAPTGRVLTGAGEASAIGAESLAIELADDPRTLMPSVVRGLLDLHAVGADPGDLEQIVIEPRGGEPSRYVRRLDTWTAGDSINTVTEKENAADTGATDSANETEPVPTLDPARASAVDDLVAWLTARAGEAELRTIAGSVDPMGRVLLIGFDGDVHAVLSVGATPEGALVLAGTSVVWTYQGDEWPTLLAEIRAHGHTGASNQSGSETGTGSGEDQPEVPTK